MSTPGNLLDAVIRELSSGLACSVKFERPDTCTAYVYQTQGGENIIGVAVTTDQLEGQDLRPLAIAIVRLARHEFGLCAKGDN